MDAGAKFLNATALATNQHAGAGGLEFDLKLVSLAGDVHAADASCGVLLVDEKPNLLVLLEEERVSLGGGVPAGAVFLGDPQAQAGRVNFVSHRSSPGVRRLGEPHLWRCGRWAF